MAVWGSFTNSCKRREVKSKGEEERYKHLNAEFQRIARRDKKAFLSDQYKEMEKKCKKAQWLSGEALQIAVKRGERQRRKGKI